MNDDFDFELNFDPQPAQRQSRSGNGQKRSAPQRRCLVSTYIYESMFLAKEITFDELAKLIGDKSPNYIATCLQRGHKKKDGKPTGPQLHVTGKSPNGLRVCRDNWALMKPFITKEQVAELAKKNGVSGAEFMAKLNSLPRIAEIRDADVQEIERFIDDIRSGEKAAVEEADDDGNFGAL